MRLFWAYFKSRLGIAALCAGLCGVFLFFGWLCGLERSTMLYCLLLWAVLCVAALALGYVRAYARHKTLEEARAQILFSGGSLPQPGGPLEEDYQELLHLVLADRAAVMKETDRRTEELTDYFTLWAHQIKNPLAAMRLILQQGEIEDIGELEQELFETEQYVEMVLSFLRLGSDSTDFVFQPYDLDSIVRQVVKKYARQFIRRRIRLDYDERTMTVLTDEKWLSFVIEQLVSNALKYTSRGWISITTSGSSLIIRDTGIGIAPEDLPRIFEKGYTGYNGRTDKKSTGIGLWLCRQVLDKLGHEISITSVPGEGTEVTIEFGKETEPEGC